MRQTPPAILIEPTSWSLVTRARIQPKGSAYQSESDILEEKGIKRKVGSYFPASLWDRDGNGPMVARL